MNRHKLKLYTPTPLKISQKFSSPIPRFLERKKLFPPLLMNIFGFDTQCILICILVLNMPPPEKQFYKTKGLLCIIKLKLKFDSRCCQLSLMNKGIALLISWKNKASNSKLWWYHVTQSISKWYMLCFYSYLNVRTTCVTFPHIGLWDFLLILNDNDS